MSKHTTGPWKADSVFRDNMPNTWMVHVAKFGGPNIADCGESGEANAKLIAAAPEMFNALSQLKATADKINAMQHAGNEIPADEWAALYSDCAFAGAILAKATA